MVKPRVALALASFCAVLLAGSSVALASSPPSTDSFLRQLSQGENCQLPEVKASALPDLGTPEPIFLIIWPDCAYTCGDFDCQGSVAGDPCGDPFGSGTCVPINNSCGEVRRSLCYCMS